MWQPGDCQRARLGNQKLSMGDSCRERRFYSKRLLLPAVTNVATKQTSLLPIAD